MARRRGAEPGRVQRHPGPRGQSRGKQTDLTQLWSGKGPGGFRRRKAPGVLCTAVSCVGRRSTAGWPWWGTRRRTRRTRVCAWCAENTWSPERACFNTYKLTKTPSIHFSLSEHKLGHGKRERRQHFKETMISFDWVFCTLYISYIDIYDISIYFHWVGMITTVINCLSCEFWALIL